MARTFTLTLLDIPNVGHGVGLALVLQTPGGRTWLYDAGTGYPEGEGWAGNHNTGRDLIAPFLEEHGIAELDGVIMSHAHYDHFGGLLWLADHVPIGRLVDSGYDFGGWRDDHYDEELACYSRLRERFRQRPGAYQAALAGDALDLDGALDVQVIAPPAGFFRDPDPASRSPRNPAAHYMLNTNSLMLRIRHGKVVFLLPGDIEKEDQARLLVPGVPPETLKCDVLVAPGHGLHTAPEFAQVTRPRVTAVSLYQDWIGGCTAIQGFQAVGSQVFVTGLYGTVQIVSDGTRFEVQPMQGMDA